MLAAVLIATDLLFTAYHIHCQPLRPEGFKPQKFTAQELNYFTAQTFLKTSSLTHFRRKTGSCKNADDDPSK